MFLRVVEERGSFKDIHQYTQALLFQARGKVAFPYLFELRHTQVTLFH